MLKLRKILLCDFLYYLLLFLSIIFIIVSVNIPKHSKYNKNENTFKLKITNIKYDGNKVSLELLGKEKLISTIYVKEKKELDKYKKYKIGDTLLINGTLNIPNNNTIPNLFNYKKYLYYHNIFYILKINNIKKIKNNNNIFYNIKNIIIKRITNFKYKEYFYTFIMGETYYIKDDVMSSYRNNGITHLFALSGMHVGVISLIILSLLKLFKISEKKRYIITIIFLLLLMFIADFSPSILRAVIFFVLLSINEIYYLHIKTINIFYLTFIILVLFNPFNIYDLGFILSFTVTFFLILSSQLINNKNKIKQSFLISFISFLSSFPIIINNFYTINILSIVINLLFVPFVSIIVFPLTLLTFFISIFEPLLNVFLNIMEFLTVSFNNISFFNFISSSFNIYFVILYYLLLIMYLKKNKRKYLLIIFLIININKYLPKLDNNSYIYYLDVGQGDSSLIITPHQKEVIVIDVGGKIKYKEENWQIKNKEFHISDNLLTFYKSLGIEKINQIYLTHGDEDHMGEAINVINNIKTEKVMFNYGSYNKLEKKLISVLEMKNIKYSSYRKELNIDKYKLQFLKTKVYDNENDNSIVIYLKYNNYKFLFMGDAGLMREKDILKKYELSNIDFIKIGHHGSNTSSSEEFINSINPKYSLISVGNNNRYGHPKQEVLDNLNNSKIYRTDTNGSVEIKLNKSGYKISTCPP